jgi:protein-disulfide isomerase
MSIFEHRERGLFMRWPWKVAVAVVVTVLASTGCTHEISGLARAENHHPGVVRSSDGSGVLVGSPDAPVRLETFIEPQCPHCAHFESAHGDKIGYYLGSGRLAITYRPMTFLDATKHNDTSARVSNALFLAADPAVSATQYQAFVQNLFRHQGDDDDPSDEDIAALARESGVPDTVATRIEAGDSGVDVDAMASDNKERLKVDDPEDPVTPTVYDLKADKVVNIKQSGWLDKLFRSV